MACNTVIISLLLLMSAALGEVIDLSRVCDGLDEGYAQYVFTVPGTYISKIASREVRRLRIDSLRNSEISLKNLPNLELIEIDNSQFDTKEACQHIAKPFWRTIKLEFEDVIYACTPVLASSSLRTSQTTTVQETTEVTRTTTREPTTSSARQDMTDKVTRSTTREPTTIQPTPESTRVKLDEDGTTQDNDEARYVAILMGFFITVVTYALMSIERWMYRIVNRMLVSLQEKFHTMIDKIVKRVFNSLLGKFRTMADKIVSLTRGAPSRQQRRYPLRNNRRQPIRFGY